MVKNDDQHRVVSFFKKKDEIKGKKVEEEKQQPKGLEGLYVEEKEGRLKEEKKRLEAEKKLRELKDQTNITTGEHVVYYAFIGIGIFVLMASLFLAALRQGG